MYETAAMLLLGRNEGIAGLVCLSGEDIEAVGNGLLEDPYQFYAFLDHLYWLGVDFGLSDIVNWLKSTNLRHFQRRFGEF